MINIKYYAVIGTSVIINNWTYCKKVVNHTNLKYKGFKLLDDALKALNCSKYMIKTDKYNKTELKDNPFFLSSPAAPVKFYASMLERTVADYLDSHNIKYKTQYDTLKCINPMTNQILPYDFELPDYKIIIEVQGEQHYSIGELNKTKKELKYQQKKDKIKKEFAIKNGYTFIELDTYSIHTNLFEKELNKYFK